MDDLISLIVPVYNGEEYLEKFLKQYQAQTYGNIELILVDDGSTDSTGRICDLFSKENSGVYVFHKKNGGPSSARNFGLQKAKGKYVVFADVDDYIYPTYIEYLSQLIHQDNADMSVCECIKVTEKEDFDKYKNMIQTRYQLFSQNQAIDMFCYRRGISGYPYLKLIKTEIARSVSFPEDIFYGEDFIYVYNVLKKCRKIAYGNKIEYIYIQYKNSSTHQKRDNTKRYEDSWRKHLEFLEDVRKNYASSYLGALAKCYILAINNTTRLYDKKRDKVYLQELYSFIKNNAFKVFKDKRGKKSNRLLGGLGIISARGTCCLCSIMFWVQDKLGMTLRHTT